MTELQDPRLLWLPTMHSLRDSVIASAFGDAAFQPAFRVVENIADLQSLKIGHLDFRGLTFRSFVDFRYAHLRGVAWFDDAVFEAGADFSYASFDRDARFDRAVFQKDALFVASEFRGVADFDGAQFNGRSVFDQSLFFANASFGNASFLGSASFRDAQMHGGLWGCGAKFATLDATGAVVSGRAFLINAAANSDPAGLLSRLKG